MSQSPIEEFVEVTPDRLPSPRTEEVIHYLFAAIEQDPVLLRRYHVLCEQYRSPGLPHPANVKRIVGSWVRKKTGRTTLSSSHPSTRSTLIKTWSRLA